ncbi:MAG: PAS domain-containing protein [Ferrovibrio sp.]|uniref:PAS domain-containing protein n=1 Tax=Ferrovibrio sp. TaxID=1917215 RepID=UPI003918EF8C
MSPLTAETASLCARCHAGAAGCKQHLLQLHNYWEAKRNRQNFPRRTDIEPLELGFILPNLFLVDVLPGLEFRYRLTGTEVDEIHGINLTGKSPMDIRTPEVASLVQQQYEAALLDRRPRCDHLKLVGTDGSFWHYERLILPLSEDGHTINMLLGGIYLD